MIDKIKQSLKRKPPVILAPNEYLSTGSTVLNLACSGRVNGGFGKGRYYFIVGDSASGKTWLVLTCLAEASISPVFKNYRFIYDNSEDGALMDVERFFGESVAGKIEPPALRKGEPVFSSTIEEFYYNLHSAAEDGRPFVYILDSMDSLSSEEEITKFLASKKAHATGDAAKGSYGTAKARANSGGIRQILPKLRKTGSILIVISQTRDNLGFGFETKTRSGGKALRFYATVELWSSVVGKIRKTVMGKPRELGITAKIQVKKNRQTGRETSVDVPIYWSYGIDDLGGCVDFLVNEGFWKKKKGSIDATEFEVCEPREKLIRLIEKEGREKELRALVWDCWAEIEKACSIHRKPRY